jgi:hypothetical protein
VLFLLCVLLVASCARSHAVDAVERTDAGAEPEYACVSKRAAPGAGIQVEQVFHVPPSTGRGCLEVSARKPVLGGGIPTVTSPPNTEVPYARWIDVECYSMDAVGAVVPAGARIVPATSARGAIWFDGYTGPSGSPLAGVPNASVELIFESPPPELEPLEVVEVLHYTRGARCAL